MMPAVALALAAQGAEIKAIPVLRPVALVFPVTQAASAVLLQNQRFVDLTHSVAVTWEALLRTAETPLVAFR